MIILSKTCVGRLWKNWWFWLKGRFFAHLVEFFFVVVLFASKSLLSQQLFNEDIDGASKRQKHNEMMSKFMPLCFPNICNLIASFKPHPPNRGYIWKFNVWMVFDHVSCVKEWTTMVCHIYNPIYYKIMTNAIYGM
jgi:hypothetical protein